MFRMDHRSFWPPHKIAALAERIEARAEAQRIVRLSPATALLVADALRSYATRPIRNELIPIICGKEKCSIRRDCISCIGRANLIMDMFGKRDE
jgi:hypothetical protein